jgi:hypothetical protein
MPAVLLFLLPLAQALFGLDTGDRAPSFANPDLHNRHQLARDYLGKGWLILDFFATDGEPRLFLKGSQRIGLGPRRPGGPETHRGVPSQAAPGGRRRIGRSPA